MGTQKSMAWKFDKAESMISKAVELERDIIREDMIAAIMYECKCERRKAVELIFALMPKFPYTETKNIEGKIVYLFQFNSVIKKEEKINKELNEEELGILKV